MATMNKLNRKYYKEMVYASQNYGEETNLHESRMYMSVRL